MSALVSTADFSQNKAAIAAENGKLQNGQLTSADGWQVATDNEKGYGFSDGYLSIWTEEGQSADFAISQTVENVEGGQYKASLCAVGNGNQGESTSPDNLTLEVKDNKSGDVKSVKITTNGWDNWENTISTEKISIAEGSSVTITIRGKLGEKEWYGIRNVVFDKDTAMEAPINVKKVAGLSKDFIHGVDVSSYLSLVQSGVKYYDGEGKEKNLFEIFADAGVNYVRLRVWNCPYVVDKEGKYVYVDADGKEYSADQVDEQGRKKEKGFYEYFLKDNPGKQVYREGYGGGNCDVETAAIIGKLATEHGMKVLIDFHYSDFWADPQKKAVPKAWDGMELEQKKTALSAFTAKSLKTIKDAGVDIGMVQIGNEINNGMAGESDAQNVYALLVEAGKAVRSVDKNILIAVHYTDPQNEGYQMGKAKELQEANVDYDVFATSYYPFWHGTPEEPTKNLKEIADTYDKKVMVAEVSYTWTREDGDGYGNVAGGDASNLVYNYPQTVEGQATAIRDTVAAVSAVGDKGIGTFYWEPAWIPVNVYDSSAANAAETLKSNELAWRTYGSGWGSVYAGKNYDNYDPQIVDDRNGGTWDNQAFFDFTGKALSSLNVYRWVYTGADGPIQVANVDTLSCEMDYAADPQLPAAVQVNLNNGTSLTAPVVWDSAQLAELKKADFGEYTIAGDVGEFSFESKGKIVTVPAGTWTTAYTVKITGENYVTNGSFEDNNGDGSGWTLTNYLGGDVASPSIDTSSSNAKTGTYYYKAWGAEVDFAIEQILEKPVPNGSYTLFAYYQGTEVGALKDTSKLYAMVTYSDGTSKEYNADIKINNVWKDFYQAKVSGIEIDKTVTEIKVGTRLSCSVASGSDGAWVVVDDISLMKSGELSNPGPDLPDNPAPAVKKVTLSSVKNLKGKKITVTWKKISSVSGYQVKYSTGKSFKAAKTQTVNVKKASTVKCTVKKLQKKKYYVKVRAYKTLGSKKTYGKYSAVKQVTVKK